VSDQISRPGAIIIGGLACALGLTRKGVRVRLYEKSEEFGSGEGSP
jgi:2-polyprenyl-6-methoxyphenol hydroxylase-like FAD-dependent oxidoreductase